MTIKALLFDKDGTLIDFDATWGTAAYPVMQRMAGGDAKKFAELVRVNEYLPDERRFLPTSPLVAGSSALYGPLWAEALGRPSGPELFAEMDRLFAEEGLKALTPIGDPAGVLAALAARGLPLGVATNDSETSARLQAEALGLTRHLGFLAGYDSGFGSKPNPGMVLAFAAGLDLHPREVALVGDTLHDLHAAKAAGAGAIAVLTGPRRAAARAELEPHADYVVNSIADLPALVDALAANAAPPMRPEP